MNSEQILQDLPADEQARLKSQVAELDFSQIDLGVMGKQLLIAAIDLVQKHIVPMVQKQNASIGFLLAAVLEGIEKALK